MRLAAVVLTLMLAVAGCKGPWMKNVQGSSLTVGITIPGEEVMQLEALHDLDGARWSIGTPSFVVFKFESSCTNTYFGVVRRARWQKSCMIVDPSATNNVEIVKDELAAEQHR